MGIDRAGVHLIYSPNGGGSVFPADLMYAENLRSLQALTILDWYREQVATDPMLVPPLQAWTPLLTDRSVFAVGRGPGQAAVVEVHDARIGELLNQFTAYEQSFV